MTITAEQRLAWWHEVRFGMFIHWGLYAALAGEWNGKKTTSIAEWIMRDLKIPVEEYEKIARWVATYYDESLDDDVPDWLYLALEAVRVNAYKTGYRNGCRETIEMFK